MSSEGLATFGSLFISIAVLVVVSLSKNPTIAAFAASAPTGIPLALWIASTRGGPEESQRAMLEFLVGCFKGIGSTFCFVACSFASVRTGLTATAIPTILVGFAGWYVCTAVLL